MFPVLSAHPGLRKSISVGVMVKPSNSRLQYLASTLIGRWASIAIAVPVKTVDRMILPGPYGFFTTVQMDRIYRYQSLPATTKLHVSRVANAPKDSNASLLLRD